MLSKENQLKVAGLSAVLATTLGLGGALVAPATALAAPSADKLYQEGYHNAQDPAAAEKLNLEDNNPTDRKNEEHKAADVKLIDVVRLYNPWTGEHLFSADQAEVAAREKDGWKNEGTFWKAYAHVGDWQVKFAGGQKWGTAVYRLYNANNGEHLYTTSHEEYNNLKAIGWTGEGISFYSVQMKEENGKVTTDPALDGGDPDAINKTPQGVYRAFNKNVTVGTHNFGGYEENATMLANGWLPDNVVDGKQLPLFMVYDLDHTVNEAKISQALTRISKEYKVNLEKYKALKKELLDALLAAKYDKDTELNNLAKVSDVTTSLQQQMNDAKEYLTKLKYQADQIIADLDGKYGKDGSEAKSKAYEVLFEKDNYFKLKSGDYATAVTTLNTEKVTLSSKKGDLMKEQGVMLGLKGDLDSKTALYNDAKSAYDTCADAQKNEYKGKLDTAKANVKTAQDAVDVQQKRVDAAQKEVDDQQKKVDKAAAKVKDLSEKLKAFKNLFNENVQKFQDFRHSQDLKKSQALRDLEAYAKYAMVYVDLESDLKTLAEKEVALKGALDNDSVVNAYNKVIEDALTAAKTDKKLPDLSKLKAALESTLDEYFLRVVPGDDGFNF